MDIESKCPSQQDAHHARKEIRVGTIEMSKLQKETPQKAQPRQILWHQKEKLHNF
jgi:hypothetical protein